MKKKLLYIGTDMDSYEKRRFQEEAERLGFDFFAIQYKNLSLKFSNGTILINLDKKICFNENDVVILRKPKIKKPGVVFLNLLACYLHDSGVKTNNLEFFISFPSAVDKLWQQYFLIKNGFPAITPAYFFNSDQLFLENIEKLEFNKNNYIIKPRISSQGRGVIKIANQRDCFPMKEGFPGMEMLIQKYIPNKFDLRIICTQNKILGAMKRSATEGKITNNFNTGGKIESYELTNKKIIADCLKICRIFKCDYIGIDLILTKKSYLILEVNFFCGFEGFEKATGINLSNKIIELVTAKRS